jgi:hypothetical protein
MRAKSLSETCRQATSSQRSCRSSSPTEDETPENPRSPSRASVGSKKNDQPSGRGCKAMQVAKTRRFRPIATLVEGLHAQIIRKAGARQSVRPNDGYWSGIHSAGREVIEPASTIAGRMKSVRQKDGFWSGSRSAGRTPNRYHPSDPRSEWSNPNRSRRPHPFRVISLVCSMSSFICAISSSMSSNRSSCRRNLRNSSRSRWS